MMDLPARHEFVCVSQSAQYYYELCGYLDKDGPSPFHLNSLFIIPPDCWLVFMCLSTFVVLITTTSMTTIHRLR